MGDGRRGDAKRPNHGTQGTPARRRRRRTPDPHTPFWATVVIFLGSVLMLVSGTTMVVAQVIIRQATSNIAQTTLIAGAAAAPPAGKSISGPLNLLLVGIDVRPGGDDGARSDTIMIVHVPASHDQAYLISIPRDWRVPIPPHYVTGYGGGLDKINAAFAFGYQGGGTEIQKRARGVELLARTLYQQTGIQFNGAALIDFQGFEGVVRELGGVDMCVDQRAESIHLGYDHTGRLVHIAFDEMTKQVSNVPPGGRRVVHEIGCRRMSPELALDFARIRYGLPKLDYDRQRHQQQLLKAIGTAATSRGVVTDLGKLNRVIAAAGKAFLLDTRGAPVADFLFTLKGVSANAVTVLKTNNGDYNGQKIDDVSYESMTDESMGMLHSARDGRLEQFVLTHPGVRAVGAG